MLRAGRRISGFHSDVAASHADFGTSDGDSAVSVAEFAASDADTPIWGPGLELTLAVRRFGGLG